MPKRVHTQQYWQRFSLTTRFSGLLVLAAIIPLLLAVVVSEFLLRPALIDQARKAMETDAHTRTELIDAYMAERLLDTETISKLAPIQQFLAGDPRLKEQARESLATGHVRGSHYENWSLFDLQGHLRLYYPTAPQAHGAYFVLPNALQQLQTSSRSLVSDVFYDHISNDAYIDLYTSVVTPSYKVVGILRTTFDLSYIWQIVDNDANANGTGSYALILDENGVRIASTNFHAADDPTGMTAPPEIFTAIAPLSSALQQRIRDEELYGISGNQMVPVLNDPAFAAQQKQNNNSPFSFEMVPAGQHESFEAVSLKVDRVPWTYVVLSPLSTVTALADQQLRLISLSATLILILTVAVGIVVGKQFAQPIVRSLEKQRLAYEHEQRLNQLKDQFLANVNHELRTPITEIYGYLNLLLEGQDQLDSALQTTFLKRALSGCEELTLMVNNILDIVYLDSQMKPPSTQKMSVEKTVKEVLEQFDPRKLQKYEIHIQVDETIFVWADAQLVRQVLRNLLSNAFKYAPQETLIVVSTQIDEYLPLANDSATSVVICVKDHGPGIPPEDLPLLFEKFVRLKRDLAGSVRGTGLGLYISKRLIEAMGGNMWVESSGVPGEGSCFCFTLPLVMSDSIPKP
ncbi:MAG: sensor histidine kinase [Ktedonobacteraceae bacterium]|nr:sensor histidine kinase [Ktedonobacteraceae bacterium]